MEIYCNVEIDGELLKGIEFKSQSKLRISDFTGFGFFYQNSPLAPISLSLLLLFSLESRSLSFLASGKTATPPTGF
jgi:hypothetical protein